MGQNSFYVRFTLLLRHNNVQTPGKHGNISNRFDLIIEVCTYYEKAHRAYQMYENAVATALKDNDSAYRISLQKQIAQITAELMLRHVQENDYSVRLGIKNLIDGYSDLLRLIDFDI